MGSPATSRKPESLFFFSKRWRGLAPLSRHRLNLLLLRALPTPMGRSGHCPEPSTSTLSSRHQRIHRLCNYCSLPLPSPPSRFLTNCLLACLHGLNLPPWAGRGTAPSPRSLVRRGQPSEYSDCAAAFMVNPAQTRFKTQSASVCCAALSIKLVVRQCQHRQSS